MYLKSCACIVAFAMTFAYGGVSHANVIPKTQADLRNQSILGKLHIGDVYSFRSPITVCLRKEDFEKLVDAEKNGRDANSLFKSLGGCDNLRLPHVILYKKLDEFQLRDGRKFWMLQVQSIDGVTNLFIGLPANYFSSEDGP